MIKAWLWLKKRWKWLVLPFWLISIVLVYLFRGGDKPLFPVTGTTDVAADKALQAKSQAMVDFRARLDELAKKAEERLQKASEEQLKEYEELKDKPLDEVAKWIDSLS